MQRLMLIFALSLVASGCQARLVSQRPLRTAERAAAGCGGSESIRRIVREESRGAGGCQAGAPPLPLGTGIYYLTIGEDGPRGVVNVTAAKTGEPLGIELDLAGFASGPSFNQPLGSQGWTIGIGPDGRSVLYAMVLAASADAPSGPAEVDYCVHAASSTAAAGCSMTWLRVWEEGTPLAARGGEAGERPRNR